MFVLLVIAKKSHGADGNVGDMHKDIDELRLQRWTVEQKALLLKQENLMAIQEQQETALMAARMMASAPPPGTNYGLSEGLLFINKSSDMRCTFVGHKG